ncbi:hypothetical protein Ddye_031093 [Dipteronia dyeriana]|uniref:Uncharacterized protein n=1 Tax=Dipteronia dyeriana TaxID=168575 RepID=A0AAD9WM85_9ROSI|nr:hypothetical protein Ddye_031093 [Dipteronia dyeriana]
MAACIEVNSGGLSKVNPLLCYICLLDGTFFQAELFAIISYTHNWWHVALCYLEGHSPIRKVLEVYDNHIWKELEKTDAVYPEVCYFVSFQQTIILYCYNT